MKKKEIIKKVTVNHFSVENLKRLLWQFYFSPEDSFKWLGISSNDITPQEMVDYILEESKNAGKNLFFGQPEPFLSTEGVDLGIKYPVVRDAILERCHSAMEENHCIEKAIKLIRTEDDGSEMAGKRIHGGLREIGFSYQEATYLRETCALYPISLLLERLYKNMDKETQERLFVTVERIQTRRPVEEEKPQATALGSSFKYVKNMELIKRFYAYLDISDVSSTEDVKQDILVLEEHLERLTGFLNVLETLDSEGISFDELKEQREKIMKLSEALSAFELTA